MAKHSLSTRMPWTIVLAGLLRVALLQCIVLSSAEPARSQELEPRVYSASPIDTNFAVGVFTNSAGNVSLDPSLPLSDVRASINTSSLSFVHTFPFAGRTATWAVAVPYLGGRLSAAVYGQTQAGTRNGFPDLRLRFSVDLLSRALAPAEFARRKPRPTLGMGVTVIAPTGTYDPTRLINIGSNRWTLKPEIGVEVPIGKWFADFAAGVWIFGENADYFGGQVLQQGPLAVYQIHAGYSFRPGQWLALDWGYAAGGATTVGQARPLNPLANSRYGLAFSQPLGPGVSAKVSWSHWLSGQFGQEFTTMSAGLQYRWFNRR
jgi:Putative MetA-pathway of phenol degradation